MTDGFVSAIQLSEVVDQAPTIDTHAHVFLSGVLGHCGEAGPELTIDNGVQTFRAGSYTIRHVRFRDSPMSDPEKRLALMDRMGIDMQLLSPYPILYFYDQPESVALTFCRRHNDEMAALVERFPKRLRGLATLPMQAPARARDELRRAVEEKGLVGAYVGRSFQGRELSDEGYGALWREFERLGIPVVVHPGPLDAGGRTSKGKWDLDLILGFAVDETFAIAELVFGGVLDCHPALVAVIPQGGGFAPFVRARFEAGLAKRPWGANLLHRPFHDVWNQLVFDSLVGDQATLEYLVRAHGSDRIVLGTNFAAWDHDDGIVDQLRTLPIPAEQCAAILGSNARRIFRL
ncbi:MAG: amidohydrolase family protein [Betaproteobacteria bacterium]